MSQKITNIAIIGAGAITEKFHLPLLVSRKDCLVKAIVDANEDRAQQLSKQFGIFHSFSDHQKILNIDIDAAIVATPNLFHAPIASDLLQSGLNVLVEKPLALNTTDCDTLIEASEKAKKTLGVSLPLRFSPANQFVKYMIENRHLGDIQSCVVHYGSVFRWPVKTDSILRKSITGGGSLIDLGPHILDLLLWWFGDVSDFDYRDDSFGGVEAECNLRLTFKSGGKCEAELSRIRNLDNMVKIKAGLAELDIALDKNHITYRLLYTGMALAGQICMPNGQISGNYKMKDLFRAVHDDFLGAVRQEHLPFVAITEARHVINLIESCYQNRLTTAQPWMNPKYHI